MSVVLALVRAWTAIYTFGLPASERTARRREIESDLWESSHGGENASASCTLIRLILGMPDDLGWRVEQPMSPRMVVTAGAAIAVLVASAWIASRALVVESPMLPAANPWHARHERTRAPAPPPPPPPPCLPSSMRSGPAAPCTPFP
jgi:hypothetical protein